MVFQTQGIEAAIHNNRIYYATIGFRDVTLLWWHGHLAANNDVYNLNDWVAFRTLVINRYQPANYQTHLYR